MGKRFTHKIVLFSESYGDNDSDALVVMAERPDHLISRLSMLNYVRNGDGSSISCENWAVKAYLDLGDWEVFDKENISQSPTWRLYALPRVNPGERYYYPLSNLTGVLSDWPKEG